MADRSANSKRPAWANHSQHYKEALSYIFHRYKGDITSVATPWKKVNNATVDGFEFNNVIVLAGRPASGKTLIADQFIQRCFDLNPKLELRVLDFQFEMLGRASKLREFVSASGTTYKQLLSAGGKALTKEVFEKCKRHAESRKELPIDIVDYEVTVVQFEKIVRDYMAHHATIENGKKIYRNTIIRIDHSVLFAKGPKEKNNQEMISNLGKCLTRLKKEFPILFLVLSQLNRNIDDPSRNKEGTYGNYVLESDIYASDELLQHADYVIGLNRPALRNIHYYGPDEYIIEDDTVLVLHFIKMRNGKLGMAFMRAMYSEMKIVDMETPGQKPKKPKTKVETTDEHQSGKPAA
jgi:replicative DNA helicase